MTDPLGETVEETGDKLITTESKYNNNKENMVIFYNGKSTIDKKQNGLKYSKNDESSALPRTVQYTGQHQYG